MMSMPELLAQVQAALGDHVGPAMAAVELPMLQVVLDDYFYDIGLMNKKTPAEMMSEFNVPSDVANQLEERIRVNVAKQLTFALGVVYPSRHYTYEIRQDTLLVVERRNTAIPANFSDPDIMDDDGSYVPERLRRS